MSRRLTILAGAGALVQEVIDGASAAGDSVQILPLVDRHDLGLTEVFGVADLPKVVWRIMSFRSTHVTMVGSLRASTAEREAFKRFAGAPGAASGDATLLRIAEKALAVTGARIVGAEVIVPGLLAQAGQIGGPKPDPALQPAIRFALDTARAIGKLDIGQAAVVSNGRVVAVEDLAGTDALLDRLADYRRQGFEPDTPLVLAKALKPQQSRAVDRPAIGPDTVRRAAAAGIVVIAVEAGGAIVIDRAGLRRLADELAVSVVGVDVD